MASGCFFPTIASKVWIFLTVRPCGVSRGGGFSYRDVAGGGPHPFRGAGFVGDVVGLCKAVGLQWFCQALKSS